MSPPTNTTTADPGVRRRRTRASARPINRFALAGGVALAALAVWEVSSRLDWVPVSVAAPTEIWAEFTATWQVLWFHAGPTLLAAIAGYVVAAICALALALIVVVTPRSKPLLYAGAVTVSSVPLIALTPMLVLLMNRGTAVRVTVAALAGFLPMFVGFVQGFGAVDAAEEELFRSLSAERWQRFRFLVLPGSLPYAFAGLKIAAASAVLGAVVAEWAGAGGTRGLGQLMVNSLFSYNVPQTWLTIVTSAVMAVGAYGLVALVESFVVRWDHKVEIGL